MWVSLFLRFGHGHTHHPYDFPLTLALIFILIALVANDKIKNRILKWTIVTLASLCALGLIIIVIYKY